MVAFVHSHIQYLHTGALTAILVLCAVCLQAQATQYAAQPTQYYYQPQ